MIIEKKSILSSPMQILAFMILFFAIEIAFSFSELSWYLNGLLKALIILLFLSLIDLSVTIKLEKGVIKKGIHLFLWGFVKIEKQILLKDIIAVNIFQNDNKYFEIKATTLTDEIILKVLPNKNPAEEELSKLALLLKNAC